MDRTSKKKTEHHGVSIAKNFVAGGIAGMVSKSSVAPLDRVKILMQAHQKDYACARGIVSYLGSIVRREGPRDLFKGNGAQMVRIFPYAALQFTSFEMYKKLYHSVLGPRSHAARFLSGSSAGVTAVTLTYPLDMVRSRLAFQGPQEKRYIGIRHVLSTVFRHEGGTVALFRGYVPTVTGMIPYAGISFYSFETLKHFLMHYFPGVATVEVASNTGGLALSVPAKLCCGAMSGAMAQTFSYPLDVTRRRMQLSGMVPEFERHRSSMFRTLVDVYRDYGIREGLYKGMSINYIRAIPMISVSFTTYELLKQLLHLDTGSHGASTAPVVEDRRKAAVI